MLKKAFLIFTITALAVACSSSDESSGGVTDNFDRTAMLTNWADNIIVPVYEDLNIAVTNMVTEKDNFVNAPTQANLDSFRTAWYNAYKIWQSAEMFNIGRAEEINFGYQMNIYPTNITDIQNNIQSQNYDLANVNNNDAVGFPALDYMLYGLADNDMDILNFYTSNADAAKYLAYVSDLVNQMESLTQDVTQSWATYSQTFIDNANNTATGSINKLINDFMFYYEKGLRANKIGIPAGNFSTTPLPDKVEAYYRSDISKTLATEALTAVRDFFNGKHYNSSTTGESLSSYLDYLNTIKNGEDLSVLINNQFDTAQSKINTLDDSFADQIAMDNTKMTEAYDALQMAVVLLKVDMLQALNVSVDYVDADGD
ncbi:imelysin family protein [Winogradskyella rapida]|uniref:Imelysin family protein n=1 Tax=Winogradskyella rapida TaxID=549701 RepID=A0ABW3KRC2_9FLAO